MIRFRAVRQKKKPGAFAPGFCFRLEKWRQVDLPQHPTPRQSKRCAKAAPYGVDNAVNVRSRVELSAQVDRNVFAHREERSSSGASRHPGSSPGQALLPAQREEGRHRRKPLEEVVGVRVPFLALLECLL